MININEVASNSFAYIGDAYYSLKVREYLVLSGYQKAAMLQKMSINFVSAQSQFEIFNYLMYELNFFNEQEIDIYKRGRNNIGHIPKNGSLKTYSVASGFEAVIGYLYLSNSERLEEMMEIIFKWRKL